MNIGEHFYCSRCMTELAEEGKCIKCGYDPCGKIDLNALEEGTLLQGVRFQIGAVQAKTDRYYYYGAYDYLKQKPVSIWELFPCVAVKRIDDIVSAEPGVERQFSKLKEKTMSALSAYYESFEENNTVYVCMPIEETIRYLRLDNYSISHFCLTDSETTSRTLQK